MSVRAVLTLVLCVLCYVPGDASADDRWRGFGDVRLQFFASERAARDGLETREEGMRLRLRAGAETPISTDWMLRGRLAGRFTTDQDRTRFWLKSWAPTRTGLDDGDATIDELFFTYAPQDAAWSLRLGRFQTSFALADLMAKSLDRKNSSNVSIHWTDGLHWQYALSSAWRSHVVLQHNASRGTGSTFRAPLSFDDSASRVSMFTALESTTNWGPVKQRVIGVTWLPSALATNGIDATRRDDYVTLTARGAAEWPLGDTGTRGVLGLEIGYAPNTPANSVVNSGDRGSAGGTAGQLSVSLFDFAPQHDISFAYGLIDAGWLISPSYRGNDLALEIRYRWRISNDLRLEVRVRRREERALPSDAMQARIDEDLYVRLTARF